MTYASDLSRALKAVAGNVAFVRRYFNDPVLFCREQIEWPVGRELYPYQERYMRELLDARRIAVRGPHGFGKTAGNAILVCWFACTREAAKIPWKIPTTAGGRRQLKRYLWPEINLWWKRLKPSVPREGLRILTEEIQGQHGTAFAAAVTEPALIEGAHAPQLFFVFDEGKSIPGSVFNAAEGALSNDRCNGEEAMAITTSTPGPTDGRFYEIHQRRQGLEDWRPFMVRKEEMILAGRMSQKWADDRKRQWGESSALYQNKVEGNFAASDSARCVIPLTAVEAAIARYEEWVEDGSVLPAVREVHGFDVGLGGVGRDPSAWARRRGDLVLPLTMLAAPDHNELVGRIAPAAKAVRARVVADIIGASGFVGRLREVAGDDFEVIAFNSGGRSEATDATGELSFLNLRAEMWWGGREWLCAEGSRAMLPPDDTLTGELTTPEWKPTSAGKIQVESKEDIAKRLRGRDDREDEGGSTNRADAVLMSRMDHLGTAFEAATSVIRIPRPMSRGVF